MMASGQVSAGPATLRDVAEAAGVSVATASKALSGRHPVRAATREKVERAAARLDFRPNILARDLANRRTGTIGLITNDLDGRFSIPILMGAEDAFGEGQLNILLSDARGDAFRERHHLERMLARRVDGLLMVGSRTDPRPGVGLDLPVPIVYVYAPAEDPADASVAADNAFAGRLVTEHLLELGRRHVAHIGGDPSYAAARDRLAGIEGRLAEDGLELTGPAMQFGTWSEEWGRARMDAILDGNSEVDAVICASDQIARGALDALRDRRIGVPDQIAVASFDNWEILATGPRPQLTSVDMRFQEMGRLAARFLFDAIDGRPHSGLTLVEGHLVVRGSTVPGLA